jgi:hypothetical protein
MRGKNWTYSENHALVAAYAAMALAQYNGESVNKSAIIRVLMAGECADRSRGSIEAKFMNCSAVAVQYGMLDSLPNGYVKGYKPAPNYQKVLREFLIEALNVPNGYHDATLVYRYNCAPAALKGA